MTGHADFISEGKIDMHPLNSLLQHPRVVGAVSAIVAVALGVLYLVLAGAPARVVSINVGAAGLGLAVLCAATRFGRPGQMSRLVVLVAGVALLLTALLADPVEGAARWVALGPLVVQPSLVLLPGALVLFARRPDWLAAGGLLVAAAALALQPDRAMAGVLLAGLAILAVQRRERSVVVATAGSALAFVATLARPDALPAVPFVDGVLLSAFDFHPLAGLAVWGGSALLLVPAIVGALTRPHERAAHLVFGATWAAVVAAALLGNYPTPVVGYGGAAVLGYWLSLVALPANPYAERAATLGRESGPPPPSATLLPRWALGRT